MCNVEDIPHVSENDLYNYLVLNRRCTFDSESMKAKRQLKARVFYKDRHVHSIKFHPLLEDCTHGFVKCKVIPSLPTLTENKKPDYDVWICLSKETGNVHSAGCTCSAGEGESCNHVAALLYALVDISSKKKDGFNSPTSDACKWNKPRARKLSPKKSQDLTFKKLKFSTECTLERKSHAKSSINISPDTPIEPVDVMEFSNKLKLVNPYAAFLQSTGDYVKASYPEHEIPKLHNIDLMYYDKANLQSDECMKYFKDYFASLHCEKEECERIQDITKGQANNKNWLSARIGRITSSKFGRVCKLKKSTSPNCTVREVMGYIQFDSDSVRWGRTHELAAKRLYQIKSKVIHTDSIVTESGLWVNEKFPHLGSSPDGLVTCKHCEELLGPIEVKCPFKFRDMTPLEAAKDPSFCCEVIGAELKLKQGHDFYYQVQGQMGVCDRKWCDFVIWTLRGYHVERIFFDERFWILMLEKLNSFYLKAIIPELFSERIKRGLSLYNQ